MTARPVRTTPSSTISTNHDKRCQFSSLMIVAMRFYEATRRIERPVEEVWSVLRDVATYPDWDSGVLSLDGDGTLGSTIELVSAADPGRRFRVRVVELIEGRSMVWRGGAPLGLFRGTRTYSLTQDSEDATTVTVREEFTGPLVPLIWRTMPDLQPSFDRFVDGLAARVTGR